jgi:signal transduction histidine kinase
MRERMESIGGRLEIESTPGKGTEVILLYQRS